MFILVTGGAGYIGSHVVRALQQANFKPVVLDNLVYGHRDIVEKVLKVPFVEGNIGDKKLISQLISGNHKATSFNKIKAVMHFAAFAYVGESMKNPAKYYLNNVSETLTLLDALKVEIKNRGDQIPIVFSSTCASYGVPSNIQIPIKESCPLFPINPYGRSKVIAEQLITDFGHAYGIPSVIFRYFNAAGAHPDGDIGEDHTPETHLIPLILDVASGLRKNIKIFGDDYPTPDGTCIRDYIHVCDLAEAHVLGLQKLIKNPGQYIYNLGSGKGYSVKEVISKAEFITNKKITFKVSSRRLGDPPILYASPIKAIDELFWKPKFQDLSLIIKHAWNWHQIRFK